MALLLEATWHMGSVRCGNSIKQLLWTRITDQARYGQVLPHGRAYTWALTLLHSVEIILIDLQVSPGENIQEL